MRALKLLHLLLELLIRLFQGLFGTHQGRYFLLLSLVLLAQLINSQIRTMHAL